MSFASELSEKLDVETTCDSAVAGKSASPECAGIIPAGQPHHLWRGVMREKEKVFPGTDPNDDVNCLRYCVHCVRAMNAHYYEDLSAICVRVEVTFADGSKRALEGDAADDWKNMVGGMSAMAFAHGMHSKPLLWKTIPSSSDEGG